jgi:hypothetical protein
LINDSSKFVNYGSKWRPSAGSGIVIILKETFFDRLYGTLEFRLKMLLFSYRTLIGRSAANGSVARQRAVASQLPPGTFVRSAPVGQRFQPFLFFCFVPAIFLFVPPVDTSD